MIYFVVTAGFSVKHNVLLSTLIGITIAFSDELHQFYTAGRAPKIKDVWIDTFGIITGIFLASLCYRIIKNIKRRAKNDRF